MPAIDPVEVAHALMLNAARSVSEREVRNELGDHVGVGIDEMPESEFDALVARVLDEVRTTDIEIGGTR